MRLLLILLLATAPPIYLLRNATYDDVKEYDGWVPASWGEMLAHIADTPNFVERHGGTDSITGVVVELFNTERGGGTERTWDATGKQTAFRSVEPTVRTNYWVVAKRWVDNLTPDSPFGRARGSCRR